MATTSTLPLPPTQAPLKDEYGGDEINALILDPGSHSTRAGFAGEDTPKSVVPTHYGVRPDGHRLFGENAIHLPRPDMEIRNPFDTEGLVEDWDTAARLWEYTITSRLTGARSAPTPPSPAKDENGDVSMDAGTEQMQEEQEKALAEYPLLMSEPGWNPARARERTIELAMEDWGVPAFFLAKTGQLAAYANGKATALVVDVGHQNTSVTALWEGMALKKSIVKSPLAGAFLNTQLRHLFTTTTPPIPLTPHYTIASKTSVDAGHPANATYTHFPQPPHPTFRALEEDRVLLSFKESIIQTWPGPGRLDQNLDAARATPPRPFEFPNGYNTTFAVDRYRPAEPLFAATTATTSSSSGTSPPATKPDDTLPSLVARSLQTCDVDARPHLLANVILTGAGSLIEKLPERLQADLQALYPNPRVRVIASSGTVERKFGAWIGGSVLGSLGSFHQMWVSRREYEEFGAGVVEKRCK